MISLPYPPYSPDLAPAEFALSQKMKIRPNGHRIAATERDNEGCDELWMNTRTAVSASMLDSDTIRYAARAVSPPRDVTEAPLTFS
ncbi:hypothetical protein C0J50_8207 [Silurus asotus]|uniref:Uncharacterized protein n=1 Tax=Silurus asotus TaxID=30991 RepID=A0AAD5B742_SILAS|nr:hypothetical protein C0J50_8207 [Silurus asotus]